ncbi:MAG: GTP pyrophosphokinase [Candidatus Peregrinibacteria bacterium Greene0416_62]|nr:MAG: GTP pyrophosphokinase [Candidatus Peregrinibacteria bacterium Greene0416_62]
MEVDSSGRRDRLDRWMDALLAARTGGRNDELLTGFLYGECAAEPGVFLDFLRRWKSAILGSKDALQTKPLASRYLSILSPIAERFGMFQEKTTIDTLCFHILQPEDYALVMAYIDQYGKNTTRIIDLAEEHMRELLKTLGIAATVTGRFKEPYSIHRKMLKKGIDAPMSLHDIFAFRIIVERHDRELCFSVLNMLHDRFTPLPEHFKDYITIPKGNGYQSIHTCLLDLLPGAPMPVEVQIRTQAMDDCAERGLASHWVYSRSKQSPRMTRTEMKLLEHMRSADMQATRTITCLTRDGDVLMLPPRATVLDFAYALHTHVGNRAQSARVNGMEVPLEYRLQNLDQVHILQSSSDCVCPQWTTLVTSDSSRRKIHAHTRS